MELEIKESEPLREVEELVPKVSKKYTVEINDKFIIESSHEVVIAKPYNGEHKWVEEDNFKPSSINEYEKELLKGSKTPAQILEEEEKEKESEKKELSEEEKLKEKKKELITKVKVIALDKMDKHPLVNPSFFSIRDKRKLIETYGRNS